MEFVDRAAGETILRSRTKGGMACYFYPKRSCREKFAAIAVPFGSNMLCFDKRGESKAEFFPAGAAHFLEHKMFQQSWGDAFMKLQEQGAQANAFTDNQKTVYYFSCQKNFRENLALLLDFVQHPYFTEADVEREKSIIQSEIAMYDDLPQWAGYAQMLEMMYAHHPVRIPIAGTKHSVESTTAADLKKIFEAAYLPQNFSLICAGGIYPREIMEMAEQIQIRRSCGDFVWEKEPSAICERYRERNMEQSRPFFYVGWKMRPQMLSVEERLEMDLLMDLWMGESSDFYEAAFRRGLLDEPLGRMYAQGEEYRFYSVSGASFLPEETAEMLMDSWKRLQKNGIEEEAFERLKKKQIAKWIRAFGTVQSVAMSQLDWLPWKVDLGQVLRVSKSLHKKQTEKLLQNTISEDKMVLSVIR